MLFDWAEVFGRMKKERVEEDWLGCWIGMFGQESFEGAKVGDWVGSGKVQRKNCERKGLQVCSDCLLADCFVAQAFMLLFYHPIHSKCMASHLLL